MSGYFSISNRRGAAPTGDIPPHPVNHELAMALLENRRIPGVDVDFNAKLIPTRVPGPKEVVTLSNSVTLQPVQPHALPSILGDYSIPPDDEWEFEDEASIVPNSPPPDVSAEAGGSSWLNNLLGSAIPAPYVDEPAPPALREDSRPPPEVAIPQTRPRPPDEELARMDALEAQPPANSMVENMPSVIPPVEPGRIEVPVHVPRAQAAKSRKHARDVIDLAIDRVHRNRGPSTESEALMSVAKSAKPGTNLGRHLNPCDTPADVIRALRDIESRDVPAIENYVLALQEGGRKREAGLFLLAYLLTGYVPRHPFLRRDMEILLPTTLPSDWGVDVRRELRLSWPASPYRGADPGVFAEVKSVLKKLYGN